MVSMRVVKTRIGSPVCLEMEIDLRAFGAADPIALHGEDPLGPSAFERLQFFRAVRRHRR